ncbi:wee wee-unclassified kinase [Trichoderma arundinaceum]|uniref:Wee wee-unclassified kinase n=1 Tax=Trichoderma arundinaceum TaxID=490622 RepID=A0A395NQV3_TRIAR|nr:wee wee-unclassified kinase [Trichoderma arundinaceum]
MSFSNGGGGGTLALPSPTHIHHMDPATVRRNLRRSMSRSPTKLHARGSAQGSDSTRHGSLSPCRRFATTPTQQRPLPNPPQSAPPAVGSSFLASAPHLSPAQTPLRPGVKLSLRSAKSAKTAPSSRITRTRASPKSPLKRALSATSDSGNSTSSHSPASPPRARFVGQENNSTTPGRSTPRKVTDRSTRHSVHFDLSVASPFAFLKALDAAGDSSMVAATGALKRSDATMNLDKSNQGSPVAKRRSLHGIMSSVQTEDLNIFGSSTSPPSTFDIHEDAFTEYELSGIAGAAFHRDPLATPSPASNIPKRSSSLRRSTLQQRYGEKTSWGKRSGERQLSQLGGDFSTPVRHRPRLSTDSFVPPAAVRENPFAPGASTSTMENKNHQPHPLSKTLTTSTSGNSLTEEQSFYAPAKVAPKPHPFSRSLPPGAMRPTARPVNEQRAIATPAQSHQLWVGAFNSTGLISKINRNPEEEADRKMAPPDTPCKKHTNPFATFPPPTGSSGKKRGSTRYSFGGVPSTPFNPIMSRAPDTFGNPSKGLSIFQRSSALGARRGSILSVDGDDRKLFADTVDFATSMEGDAPPTPTKNLLTPSFSGLSNFSESSQESPSANRSFALSLSAVKPTPSREPSSKSIPEVSDSPRAQSEEARLQANRSAPLDCGPSPTEPISFSSFGRARSQRGLSAPPPLDAEPPTSTQPSRVSSKLSRNVFTKMMCVDSVSPADGRRTPQTPQENLLPLDTSRLSISRGGESRGENSMPPPVTPTTARDFRSSTSIFVTPVNVRTSSLDIDASLYSKFDKVEQIGKGEFSTVYRVTKQDHQNAYSISSFTPIDSHARSPAKRQVFAVKKSKQPYHGPKDRDAKLREARILRALSHAEHVVQYIDDWEHNFHLYIQTEFCEEGTLDKFLANVGQFGRLDDFRIYKILQDLCLGLKEIHDAGFMHLDMKPANILVTFEGVIKIGDFGLAQAVSEDVRLDIEGDREYMAPEMLEGKADQSADIFSLGLMTLEAAANVMLPDNGPTWVALRSGDLSEVPSLTWTPSSDVQRDALGNPTESAASDDLRIEKPRSPSNLFGSFKRSELQQPPEFMVEAFHPSSLDSIVRWMTQQEPEERPRAEEVLALEGLQWVAEHRNAPAIVYEGNWGPSELFPVSIVSDNDMEMTDV